MLDQHRVAGVAVGRDEPSTGQTIKVIANHDTVEQRATVGQDEGWNLAERIASSSGPSPSGSTGMISTPSAIPSSISATLTLRA